MSSVVNRDRPLLSVVSRHCRPPKTATSTCALLTSIPIQMPSLLTITDPPALGVSRILTQPCECGLSLTDPSNGTGSAGHGWDDLAGERSGWTWGSAVCPTLLRASGSFAGRSLEIQGLLALDLAGPSSYGAAYSAPAALASVVRSRWDGVHVGSYRRASAAKRRRPGACRPVGTYSSEVQGE